MCAARKHTSVLVKATLYTMTPEQYQLLFEKYLNGLATQHEIESLMSYPDGFQIKNPGHAGHAGIDPETEGRLKRRLHASIHGRAGSRHILIRWTAVAAVLILIITGLFYLNLQQPVAKSSTGPLAGSIVTVPGSNKAVLTLGSGMQIVLDDSTNGRVIRQGSATISRNRPGLLKYEAGAGRKQAEILVNTLSVPKGGQFQLVLADGTKVWMNASSTLRFPPAFTGKSRDVELSGEAYFEVAENKAMPFRVKYNEEMVEVLGTHFNIMAYNDETESQTTLLEGAVSINKRNTHITLHPGQQAVSLASKDDIAVQPARTEEVTAWKDGYFFFKDKDIRFIMRQVARWYDVDVVYQGNMQDQVYGGRMSRYKNISGLLSKLELTGTIHFKTEGKKIIVTE